MTLMRKLLSIFLGLAVVFSLPTVTQALTTQTGQTVLQSKTESVSGMALIAGGTVSLGGSYDNDVIVTGGTVTISGTVGGDLIVAGGTVKIDGDITGSLRSFGGTIEINGSIGGNITAAGGSFIIGERGVVAGETLIASGTFEVYGQINNELNFWGGTVILNGAMVGDVNIHTGDDCGAEACVIVGSTATIDGDLTYWAAVNADIDPGASITGATTRHAVEIAVPQDALNRLWKIITWWGFLSAMLVGIVIALFLTRGVREVHELMLQRPGASVGFGLLAMFATPITLIILAVTFIGLPLAVILGALYMIGVYAAQVYLGYFFGRVILQMLKPKMAKDQSRGAVLLSIVIGMTVVAIVFDVLLGSHSIVGFPLLAFLAGLVRFGLTLWAFGAIVLYKANVIRGMMK